MCDFWNAASAVANIFLGGVALYSRTGARLPENGKKLQVTLRAFAENYESQDLSVELTHVPGRIWSLKEVCDERKAIGFLP